MEDFHKLFYEEAVELISSLEDNLLILEEDLKNGEVINEVFRIMHSLKGSGAMFGYNNLSKFTHNLENLYDAVRSRNIKLSPDILNFTIEATDHIKLLLKNDDDEEIASQSMDFLKKIDTFKNSHNTTIQTTDDNPDTTSKAIEDKGNNNKLFFIKFEPNPNILSDGTNPLYLLDELADLGEIIIKTKYSDVPSLDEIDVEKCYVGWEIILSYNGDISDIQDVFIFVSDDSTIEIELISEKDIFAIPGKKDKIENLFLKGIQAKEGIKKLIKLYEKETVAVEDNKTASKPDEDVNKTTSPEKPDDESTKRQKSESKETKNVLPENLVIDTVKVSSKKLDTLINLVSELVVAQARLSNVALGGKSSDLTGLSEDFQHLSRQFRDVAFEMRLIPISTIAIKFRRLVRDLSKSLNKKVNYVTEGTDNELDKNIISTISDPIMHIIRNCIDHGIETPEERKKKGKPETGTIKLKAEYSGAYVLISIEDDGAGIDSSAVLNKAFEKKLVDTAEDYSKEEIFNILMMPGFSTKTNVTGVSGRGVGMDVVKRKINDLHGEVLIDSEKDKGTKILLKLPLTLSIIDGLLVVVNNNKYIIPLASVKKILKISNTEIEDAYKELVVVEGKQYPFISLIEKFDNSVANEDSKHFIIVNYHDREVGLIVNDLICEYQAVLKPIEIMIKDNEIFSGASILGDGTVALVVDTNKLIKHFTR